MSDPRATYLSAPAHSRDEVLAKGCPVPAVPGVYGWWFDELPSNEIDTAGCYQRDGLTLLYAGISPSKPPTTGKAPSRQSIRTRIRYHYRGNAYGSTLRLTLGCLLGIPLRRVGSGHRLHFHEGESRLNEWMGAHAFVSWVTHPEPWTLEDELIESYDLPLNLMGNRRNAFHPQLTAARSAAKRAAIELPVLPNQGRIRSALPSP
ncbi:GIY-YIG nuclease family protein [Rhodococcus sp. NPDC006774]|uniref:GIY-YIG nuclease family protein n=1 Tax=Rhodococcus sp. NPDC006774 TaxID=3157186 RepID=UPI0033F5EC31